MYPFKGKTKIRISVLVFLLILFNSFGAFALTESQSIKPEIGLSSAKVELHEKAMDKIEPQIIETLSKDGYAEVIVYMKDQVDTENIARATNSTLSSRITPYKAKMEVRRAVVDALRDKAEDTQYNLLEYLKQEVENGSVEEFTPYFIVNAIYVKAKEDVIKNIAYMGEVQEIFASKVIPLDLPNIATFKGEINVEGLEWNIEKVGANLVWDQLGIDGTGVVVGIIDTGTDWTHEALKTRWRGYDPNNPSTPNPVGNWFDAVSNRSMPYDEAAVPHGSHVMGTILGQGPNGTNKIGVAPGAKWITARAFTQAGGQDTHILAAAQFMLAPNGDPTLAPDIINNSWGGAPGLDEWFRPMVQSWRSAGILPVFSAGNERGRPAPPASVSAPANYPEAFAVAATDRNNIRADFSRRGPGPYADDLKPDISAPGVSVRSSVPGGYEGGWSGTSMSAPHIAGTAALLLSANASLSVDDLENVIMETALPLTDNDYPTAPNYGYGYGLVNAFDAVSSVSQGRGTIKGSVLIDGEDMSEPEIIHEQTITEAFYGSDIPVEAIIKDDVSVVEAELLIKQAGKTYWISIPMTKTSGDHKEGLYNGAIPYDLVEEPGLVYKIKARDYDGNVVVTPDYNVNVVFGIVPDKYATDLENFPVGWIMTGDWEWGEPVAPPTPHSGNKLFGTKLTGTYSNSKSSLLVTPPIDLRSNDLDVASLRLYHWYETELNYDKGQIFVTNDYGETWTPVSPIYMGRDNPQWKEIMVNLTQYIGSQEPIFVGFNFATDSSGAYRGWYIDDIRLIAADNEAPLAPTGLTAEVQMLGTALRWSASPEADIAGYRIYRSTDLEGEFTALSDAASSNYMDTNIEANNTYYYKVTAFDISGNESEYSEVVSVSVGQVPTFLYNYDFEENNGEFITGGTNNSWQWGVPTSGPIGGFMGSKVWATNLAGNYSASSNCWIESPEMNVPQSGTVQLNFGHWFDTENRYDYGQVFVAKKEGESWSQWVNITPATDGKFTGIGTQWANVAISLAQYRGETIKVKFNLYSDGSVHRQGWYIDYVVLLHDEAQEAINSIESRYSDQLLPPKKQSEEVETTPVFKLKDKEKVGYKIADEEGLITLQGRSGIPVEAVVTILQTGRSVKTSLLDGKYLLTHPANKPGELWTLRAEAYGYYPQDVEVFLQDGEVLRQDFRLEEIPKGNIVGRIVDRVSDAPVANATIRVKNDTRIQPVVSDENGEFIIPEVYEGRYTLRVTVEGYHTQEIEMDVLGQQDNEIEIRLKRFVGYDEEIIYDDGTAENALVLNSAGNGLAIRVTPTQLGKVKGTSIYFWDNTFPTPGGNEIGITIFDTNANGDPDKMVGEPKRVTIKRGAWNYIDLSEFGFSTDRDFFIATMQHLSGTSSPAVGIDEASPHGLRSYLHVGGEFIKIADEDVDGGLMMRAIMEYSLDAPQITNLAEISYTNQDSIVVEGNTNADCKVNFYINGQKAAEAQSVNKVFSTEIELNEAINILTVTAVMDEKETEPSKPITIIKDQVVPVLNVESPEDRIVINKEVVHIIGNAFDEYFHRLTVNNEEIQINEEGNFSTKILVNSGENIILTTAYDLAGNKTTVTRAVYVDLDAPILYDIQPMEDTTIKTDETLQVSFRSEARGNAYFRIVLPSALASSQTGIAMEEVEEGYYVGTWAAPEGFAVTNAYIEIEFTDEAGNTVFEVAEGRLTVEPNTSTDPGKPGKDPKPPKPPKPPKDPKVNK